MESFGKILDFLAAIAWPLGLVTIVLLFKKQTEDILSSLQCRSLDVQVGTTKLSIGQATDQLGKEIADIRAEFNKLQAASKKKGIINDLSGLDEAAAAKRNITKLTRILWADDKPRNNAFIVKELQDSGVFVDLATSTMQAVACLTSKRYDLVISDMGRYESGQPNYRAGIDLLVEFNKLDLKIPFVFFCPPISISKFGKEAEQLGSKLITSSSTELMAFIHHLES